MLGSESIAKQGNNELEVEGGGIVNEVRDPSEALKTFSKHI